MKEEILANWEEYENRVQQLEKLYDEAINVRPLLFRGQANSDWKLKQLWNVLPHVLFL